MTLKQAQETVMPFGAHKGETLLEVAREEPSYLTDFLAERKETLDTWLREAVGLVIENLPAGGGAGDSGQGELF